MSLKLGPFLVSSNGVLQPAQADATPHLRFAWRGRQCEAELLDGALKLAAVAARVPSTAEPGADREGAFATLATLPKELPQGWRMQLLPDHRVRLGTEAAMDSPPTATRLIAAMVRFAVALDPYLDRLESAGVSAPSGTAKT